MPRNDTTSPPLQLTWHDGALHAWALNTESGEPVNVVTVMREVEQQIGRHLSITSAPSRIPLPLPRPSARHTAAAAAGASANPPVLAPPSPVVTPAVRMPVGTLRELPRGRDQSPTVQWFAALTRLAVAAMRSGRVRPIIAIDGPMHLARWAAVADDALADALAALHEQMPPACGVADINDFFDVVVDTVTRRELSDNGWRPPYPRNGRGTEYRAAQATFRALSSAGGSVLYRSDDLPALARLARTFDDELDRALGAPVLAAQVRLHLPEDLDDPWQITLELVDVDQPEVWCTAGDIVADTPLALDLARRAEHLPRLQAAIQHAAQRIADELAAPLPAFAALRTRPDHTVELELADVETFLGAAPTLLDQVDVRLLGPEQLVRAKAGVRAAAAPRPEVSGSGRFNAGALVQWSATIDDSPVDDAQLERAAAAGTSLLHVNGRWVRLDAAQVRTTLARLQTNRDERSELDVASLLKLAADAASAKDHVDVQADGWIADLLAGLPDQQLVEMRESAAFGGELRHYQRRGLSWMAFLGRLGLGGCLADDMGLGKTATTLAHLATRPGPHLVVCPLSVVHNWCAEAARFTPWLQVAVHHGSDRVRGDAVDQLIPSDIVVTTYGLLSRDVDSLGAVAWSTLVLDEAQNVKNHLTRAARAVRHIRADQKIALTGTPVENHLGELWSILDAVNPGLYGSATQFNDRYAKPIQRDGDPAATAALRTLTQPFILRRTKADKTLLPELPDKIEQIAWATLTREQATMYQAVVDQLLADAQAASGMKRRGLVLAALTRLKQICNHPAHAAGDGSRIAGRSGKLTRFDELVDDLLANGERALVFTQFREMGLILQRHIRDRLLIDAPFLHGGVSRTGRDAMVQRFQSGMGSPLLLVSLKAGGTGLNLTSASQVIHYDRWWNPAVEDQATDRAWRLGQSQTVLVHKLVCEGTLEERISQLIDDKRKLADSVLGTGEQWLTELSTDDLRSLVTLSPGQTR